MVESFIHTRIDKDKKKRLNAAIEKLNDGGLKITTTDVVTVGIMKFIKAVEAGRIKDWL